MNTNGVAAQPNTKVYQFGGEINTPPTNTPAGQADLLRDVLFHYNNAAVNHRSNLHVHVRVPGLKESLPHLKQLQAYVHDQLPSVINVIEPIPRGFTQPEKKRERRRRVSHRTFLTMARLKKQLAARTVKEFFELEVPHSSDGTVLWHAQPRCCVNLRQLLQTDTVEFRHFPGTLDGNELLACVLWCRDFLTYALAGADLPRPVARFPAFPPFDEEREVRYQATAAKSGLKPDETKRNIDLILRGKFNERDSPQAYEKARLRAGGTP